jgi:hypothetical protein
MYKNCPLVANVLIFAHGESDFVVALVQPNKPSFEKKDYPGKNTVSY